MYIHLQPEIEINFRDLFSPGSVGMPFFFKTPRWLLKAILSTVDMSILIPVPGAEIAMKTLSRWWQLKSFLFSSLPGEMIPNLTSIFFQMGWFNHQLALFLWRPGSDFCFLCWNFYGEIETTLKSIFESLERAGFFLQWKKPSHFGNVSIFKSILGYSEGVSERLAKLHTQLKTKQRLSPTTPGPKAGLVKQRYQQKAFRIANCWAVLPRISSTDLVTSTN